MIKEKLVPELRFPEFEGEWDEIELGDMSYDSSYGMNSSATKYDGENKYIRITDICSETNIYLKDKVVSPEKKLEEKYLLEEGDILFARTGASVGKSYYYKKDDGKIYFAGFLIRFRIKKEFNYKFIFHNTLRNKYDNWVRVMSMRSGQPGINLKEYSRLKIKTPSKKEQNKIADFFELIDKKMELQEELIENLEKQKKGFMQKIFNQEVRFKDENGEDYPEWEEEKIKSKGTFYNGLRGKNKDSFINGNKKYIQYLNIFKNTIIDSDFKDYDYVLIKEDENQNQVKYGDLLFTQSSETLEEIGMTAVYLGSEEVYLNSFSFGFRFKDKDSINYKYIAYLFESETMRRKIKKEGQGSTRINLSSNRLKNIKIQLPILEEQNKIANFLSLTDKKIELEKENLENYKEYKKALMQRMFI